MPKNGDHNSHHPSPLETAEQRISDRKDAELVAAMEGYDTIDLNSTVPPPPTNDDMSNLEEDPLRAWKKHLSGQPITLEKLHAGVIVTCEYAEAGVEAGLKIASDVREIVQTLDQHAHHLALLSAKVETASSFVHKVDEDLAFTAKAVHELRKDVQALKEDMVEVRTNARQIAVVKELLGDILSRLPP